jgi:hypothetical protein
MFLAHVDCTGCHVIPRAPSSNPDGGSTVKLASAQACDRCHQEGYGERMIPLWQTATRRLYDQIEGAWQTESAAAPNDASLAEVKSILDQVRTDGSWGVHNPSRTQQVLESARDLLAARKSTAGESE